MRETLFSFLACPVLDGVHGPYNFFSELNIIRFDVVIQVFFQVSSKNNVEYIAAPFTIVHSNTYTPTFSVWESDRVYISIYFFQYSL